MAGITVGNGYFVSSLYGNNAVYATARSTYADENNGSTCNIGQYLGASYRIWRNYMRFDSSGSLPEGATVRRVRLFVKGAGDSSTTDFEIVAYSFAFVDEVAGSQASANYTGAYGATATSLGTLWNTADGWGLGLGWESADLPVGVFNNDDYTKIVLVSKNDVDGVAPTGNEYVKVSGSLASSTVQPYLLVDWSYPVDVLSKNPQDAAIISTPWQATDPIVISTVVKSCPGWLGGVRVTATDADGDIVVNLWDSPDSTTTDDIEVARLSLGKAAKDVREVTFPDPGVELQNGLYIAITGDCLVETWLR